MELLVLKCKYEDTSLSHQHAYHSSQYQGKIRDGSRHTYYHSYQMSTTAALAVLPSKDLARLFRISCGGSKPVKARLASSTLVS